MSPVDRIDWLAVEARQAERMLTDAERAKLSRDEQVAWILDNLRMNGWRDEVISRYLEQAERWRE